VPTPTPVEAFCVNVATTALALADGLERERAP
jgi:hypothetical protein